jgi:hypothetical protein
MHGPVLGVCAPTVAKSRLSTTELQSCAQEQRGLGRNSLPSAIIDSIYRVFCWQQDQCSFHTFILALNSLCIRAFNESKSPGRSIALCLLGCNAMHWRGSCNY